MKHDAAISRIAAEQAERRATVTETVRRALDLYGEVYTADVVALFPPNFAERRRSLYARVLEEMRGWEAEGLLVSRIERVGHGIRRYFRRVE